MGDIKVSNNFEVRVAKPIDDRETAPDITARNNMHDKYPGMIIYVASTDKSYELKADGTTWVEVGAGGGGGTTYTAGESLDLTGTEFNVNLSNYQGGGGDIKLTTSADIDITAGNNITLIGAGGVTMESISGITIADLSATPRGIKSTFDYSANIQDLDFVQKKYVDSLVVGLWDDRGNYNASGNTFPSTGGSGTSGSIKKGDIWTISVAGTLGGTAVIVGQTVRALVDTPGSTASNWAISVGSGGGSVTIDSVPTNGSTNAVSSDGVYDAISKVEFDLFFYDITTIEQIFRYASSITAFTTSVSISQLEAKINNGGFSVVSTPLSIPAGAVVTWRITWAATDRIGTINIIGTES